MAGSHQDKVAVISGAARGIGQAFAHRLAHDGAHIVIADVLPATDTARLVQEAGRHAFVSQCDVSSESSVNSLAAEVTARLGRCDILINCAGIYPRQPFAEMTFADWRRMQAINLDSVFLMCAAFVPGMRARKWGRIVNMASSTLGTVVSGFVHYVASKGGVVGFTRALATELGDDGITVNAISPGLTRSPGTLARAPRPVSFPKTLSIGFAIAGESEHDCGCSQLPSFSSACCATASSRDDGLKSKSWCCGINSTSCSSARHVGSI